MNDRVGKKNSTVKKTRSLADEKGLYVDCVDESKRTGKTVKLQEEAINWNVYETSARTTGFLTRRPLKWVEILENYQCCESLETDWINVLDQDKKYRECQLQISNPNDKSKWVTIHIYLTTGVVLAKGIRHLEWASYEFPLLLDLVKETNDSFHCLPTSNFLALSLPTQDEEAVKESQQSTHTRQGKRNYNDNEKTLSTNVIVESDTLSPKRLSTLSCVKDVLADVESRFVVFKDDVENSLTDIKLKLEERDHLEDKIVQIQNANKAATQIQNLKIDDLIQENEELKQLVNKLTSSNRKLQENFFTLQNGYKRLEDQMTSFRELSTQTNNKTVSDDLEKENKLNEHVIIPSIICSNSFEVLDNCQENPQITNSQENLTQNSQIPLECLVAPQLIEREAQHITKTKQPTTPEQSNSAKTGKDYNRNKAAIQKNVLFLCDSNGKHLDLHVLYPEAKMKYVKCPTLSKAEDILIQYNPNTFPDIIFIHTGTNDLESQYPNEVVRKVTNLLRNSSAKFVESKIIFSLLIPRMDNLNTNIEEINNRIKENCKHLINISVIEHNHINREDMFSDRKHLNQNYGVKLFALNIKRGLYGTSSEKFRKNKVKKNADAERSYRDSSGPQPTNMSYNSYADATKNVSRIQTKDQRHPGKLAGNDTSIHNLLVKLLYKLDSKF